ncbi:hypothetical protein VULLAG_LOCUS6202 [Vulpes lagopus]
MKPNDRSVLWKNWETLLGIHLVLTRRKVFQCTTAAPLPHCPPQDTCHWLIKEGSDFSSIVYRRSIRKGERQRFMETPLTVVRVWTVPLPRLERKLGPNTGAAGPEAQELLNDGAAGPG